MSDMDGPIGGARVSEIRGVSVDSGAVDATVPGIAGNEYRGPSRPTTSTDTTRRIQMACSPSYPNPHPCAIDGCTSATHEHQAQLTRENSLASCPCPYCDFTTWPS